MIPGLQVVNCVYQEVHEDELRSLQVKHNKHNRSTKGNRTQSLGKFSPSGQSTRIWLAIRQVLKSSENRLTTEPRDWTRMALNFTDTKKAPEYGLLAQNGNIQSPGDRFGL